MSMLHNRGATISIISIIVQIIGQLVLFVLSSEKMNYYESVHVFINVATTVHYSK